MTTRIECPECDGEGTVEYERRLQASHENPFGDYESYNIECANCAGHGTILAMEDDE